MTTAAYRAADLYGFDAARVEIAHNQGASIAYVESYYTDEFMHEARRRREERGEPIAWPDGGVCATCWGPTHETEAEKVTIVAALNAVYYREPGSDEYDRLGIRFGVTVQQIAEVDEMLRQVGEVSRERCLSARIRAAAGAVA